MLTTLARRQQTLEGDSHRGQFQLRVDMDSLPTGARRGSITPSPLRNVQMRRWYEEETQVLGLQRQHYRAGGIGEHWEKDSRRGSREGRSQPREFRRSSPLRKEHKRRRSTSEGVGPRWDATDRRSMSSSADRQMHCPKRLKVKGGEFPAHKRKWAPADERARVSNWHPMQSVEARPYPHQILRERSSRRPRENKRAASIRAGPSPRFAGTKHEDRARVRSRIINPHEYQGTADNPPKRKTKIRWADLQSRSEIKAGRRISRGSTEGRSRRNRSKSARSWKHESSTVEDDDDEGEKEGDVGDDDDDDDDCGGSSDSDGKEDEDCVTETQAVQTGGSDQTADRVKVVRKRNVSSSSSSSSSCSTCSSSCTSASSDEEGSDEGERKKKRGGSRSGSTEAPKRGAPRAKKRDASEGPPSPRASVCSNQQGVSPHTYSDGCGPENPGSHGESKDAGSDGEESGAFDQRESTREERGERGKRSESPWVDEDEPSRESPTPDPPVPTESNMDVGEAGASEEDEEDRRPLKSGEAHPSAVDEEPSKGDGLPTPPPDKAAEVQGESADGEDIAEVAAGVTEGDVDDFDEADRGEEGGQRVLEAAGKDGLSLARSGTELETAIMSISDET